MEDTLWDPAAVNLWMVLRKRVGFDTDNQLALMGKPITYLFFVVVSVVTC